MLTRLSRSRPVPWVVLSFCALFVFGDEAFSQRRGGRNPRLVGGRIRRSHIPLANNGSLYSFINPNRAFPSQLRFAFTAVAHEDCRLFNNGATLMPIHRQLAAQCQLAVSRTIGLQMALMMPSLGNPPGRPGSPPPYPRGIAGANYSRYPRAAYGRLPYMMPLRPVYPYPAVPYNAYGGGTGNYSNYNPEPANSSGSSSLTTVSSKLYTGFGDFRGEGIDDGFPVQMDTYPLGQFGSGFDQDQEPNPENKKKTEE